MFKKNHSIGWYNGIVHLWDLPGDILYIDLEKNFKIRLLNSAKGNFTWKEFSKYHKINYKTLLKYKYKQRLSLKTIWKLLEITNKNNKKIKKEDIEVNTIKLGGRQSYIKNPKLPFNFNNPEGARIIAAILHDGGIKSNYHIPFYSNYNIKKKKDVLKTMNNIFGKINVSNIKADSIEFINIIGITLVYGIGLKQGNKVLNNPQIPEFIFNLDNNSISSYLNQAYDDDGYVCNGKRNNHKLVGITCNTGHVLDPPFPNLLSGVKKLLDELEISSQKINKSKSKKIEKLGYISQEWKLIIVGRYALGKFKENVNFGLNYKRKALLSIIRDLRNSSVFLQKPKGHSEKQALKITKKFCKGEGYIDKHILASKMNFSSGWTKDILRRLENKGFITKEENRRSIEPSRFTLVQRNG